MLQMSTIRGSFNKEKLLAFIESTEKPIKYTYGLSYRKPTTYKVPKTKDEAIHIINNEPLLDVHELDDHVHLNAYDANDMW